MMEPSKERQLAASVARRIISGQIQYRAFLDEFPIDSRDPEVQHLYSLIEHQPKVGGLFGISPSKQEDYVMKISDAIARLEQ